MKKKWKPLRGDVMSFPREWLKDSEAFRLATKDLVVVDKWFGLKSMPCLTICKEWLYLQRSECGTPLCWRATELEHSEPRR